MVKLGIQVISVLITFRPHYCPDTIFNSPNHPIMPSPNKATFLTGAHQLEVAHLGPHPALWPSALGTRKPHLPTGTKCLGTPIANFLVYVWLLLWLLHTNHATLICPSLTSSEGIYKVLMTSSAQAVNMLLRYTSSKSNTVSAIWTFRGFLLLRVSR